MHSFNDSMSISPQLSGRQQVVNVILCVLLALFVFGYIRKHVFIFPVTMETIWQIGLAETNRRRSKRRVKQLREGLAPSDIEKATSNPANNARCMASVVGYREEPGLFSKCLESYRNCPGLEIMLIGIDGDGPQDMEMANIARKVRNFFPQSCHNLTFSRSFHRTFSSLGYRSLLQILLCGLRKNTHCQN